NEPYYLLRGYSRNDRIGSSGLEKQYENVLRGRKEEIQYTTDKKGVVIDSDTIVEGKRGKDLVLSIDIEFQKKIDEIVADELKKTVEKFPTQNRPLQDAYAVAIKPKTGEILAVSAQRYYHEDTKYHKKGEVSDRAFSVLYDAHEPGSSIKGATMLAGYQEGVIQPGEVIQDKTIKVKGTPPINSWTYLGAVNDYEALARSSNTYMATIAMRMGGVYNHKNGDSLKLRE